MLMLSIEVVVRSSQLPEESSSPQSSLLSQGSRSQSSSLRSSAQTMPSVESINASPREEVLSKVRSPYKELHLSTSKLSSQSLSPSDSPRLLELLPPDVPSHSACSIIGSRWEEILLRMAPRLTFLPRLSEPERDSNQLSHPSITSLTSSEHLLNSAKKYFCFL